MNKLHYHVSVWCLKDFKEKFEENKYSYDMESKQHSIIGHHNKQLEAELKKVS